MSAPQTLAAPALVHFADLDIRVDQPQEVGQTPFGRRRLIPILGGEAVGQGWRARVLPGGADFQLIVTPRMAQLDARYTLELDGGDLIYVCNSALRVAEPELTARLAAGQVVDPALIYFRCTPRFETASTALGWINEHLFVGSGARHPDRVQISVFALK